MSKLKYLFKRILSMNYMGLFKTVNEVHKKNKKFRIGIFFDIIHCGLKYGAGYMDYSLFEMYNLTEEQRKTYLTRGKNNEYITKYNKKEYFDELDNKIKFNKTYNKYLKREWLYISETEKQTVLDWMNKEKIFIVKTVNGSCGKGVKKIDITDYENIEMLYDFLVENNYLLLEQLVIQHKVLNDLHPHSVNTIRFVNIYANGKSNNIAAYLRIGNGKHVDNFNSGGMTTPINIKSGVIELPAIDKSGNVYYKHPLTNVDIIGLKIPFWDEVVTIVDEASKINKNVCYVGWDVAITDNGPVFIEGNPFPGHDIYQLPVHTPNKIGMLPIYESI